MGNPIYVYKYPQGGNEEKVATHFSMVPMTRPGTCILAGDELHHESAFFSPLTIKNTQISGSNEDICDRNI